MPRPAKRTADELLDLALPVFWRHGPDGTTVEMLEAATGLGRQSIYHLFTDKASLYRAVVERYRALTDQMLAPLREPDVGLEDIAVFFRSARNSMRQVDCRICMAARTVAQPLDDSAVRGCAVATTRVVRDVFAIICTRLAAAGILRGDIPPSAAADLLWAAGNGAAALAALDDESTAEATIQRVIALLRASDS